MLLLRDPLSHVPFQSKQFRQSRCYTDHNDTNQIYYDTEQSTWPTMSMDTSRQHEIWTTVWLFLEYTPVFTIILPKKWSG